MTVASRMTRPTKMGFMAENAPQIVGQSIATRPGHAWFGVAQSRRFRQVSLVMPT